VRWRPRPGWKLSRDAAAPRRGLTGRRRFAIIAAIVAVLLVSLGGAAVAGVFGTASQQARAGQAARRGAAADPARSEAGKAATPATGAQAGRTSCVSVAHIGDSTSVGMVSPQWLPDPAQRLAAQYRDVGVRHTWINASGGRSIVEEMPDQRNGYLVASTWYHQGFRGCWVFALGTNDTANVAVGSTVGLMARIREMMSAAHGEPVMWVNTQTDLSSGPWSEANMQAWNKTLVAACSAYPNMRIFNWAAMVQPAWHLADGIHYTSAGYAIRAHAIANALARAFPAGGRSSGCLVS
jgi:lysophospholipase L1-like esterase